MAQESDNNNHHQEHENHQERTRSLEPIDGHHRLQYTYCIWYSRRTPGKLTNPLTYDQSLRIIATFSTVEQFWSVQSYLLRPSELSGHSDLHLFKDGIKPLWEVRDTTKLFYSFLPIPELNLFSISFSSTLYLYLYLYHYSFIIIVLI